MVSKKVTLVNAQGFHMRPASVFATMQGTWMFYILALLIGAVLGMIMLAILKRPIDKK